MWWWLNIRPATRKSFQQLLQQGRTVCLTPGGVQECLYMEAGHEIAFLKKRLGFVRIAMKEGCAHCPLQGYQSTCLRLETVTVLHCQRGTFSTVSSLFRAIPVHVSVP